MSSEISAGAAGEVRAVLADGSVVMLRPLGAADTEELQRLHAGLSAEDRYRRFFGVTSSRVVSRFVQRLVGTEDAHALVLGAFQGGRLIGVGHFEVLASAERAEVAFVVEHALHARGVATLLLEHLASAARLRGIRSFVAEVLSENAAMLHVFDESGLRCQRWPEADVVRVELDLEPDDRYRERVSDRERVADAASLRCLLRPSAVAVVGASRRRGSIGNAVLRSVLAGGYTGACYPVNRRAARVEGVPAFRAVAALPEPPELAVLCVPAPSVPEVAQECGRRGVRALCVVTAGITERPELAFDLLDAVRRWGMRLVGPNCVGVVNSDPAVRLDATFTGAGIPAGDVGVVTQSGGVGIALLEALSGLGLGVSTLVSTGDKYDVSGNDMLLWWEGDESTRAGVLYLESFGNPRKFSLLARRTARRTPLVVLRSGATPVAQRAAASHTAATATPGATRDALLRQAGVIGVDGFEELLAVLALLSWQPVPRGRRVAVVSNAGGLGALAADACARAGLEVPELSTASRSELVELLPEQASLQNPIDTTAGAADDAFVRALEVVQRDELIDVVVVPVVGTAITDPLSTISRAVVPHDRPGAGKPVLVVRAGQPRAVSSIEGDGGKAPVFAEPEVAARALAEVVEYAQWRARPRGVVPNLPGIDAAAAREVVSKALDEGPGDAWLEPVAVQDLLVAFGVPVVPAVVCATEGEALEAFRQQESPVALKAVVPGLLHKSRAGGVVLGVAADAELRSAWESLRSRFGEALRGAVLQPMAEPGREFLAGVASDPVFGPLVVFGLGGVDTDLVADRSHRLVPLTDRDATEMLHGLRSSSRLFGERAEAPLDTEGIADVLLRVARMAELLPEVVEVDLNPVIATSCGVRVPDARIRVRQHEPEDPFIRRLRV